ncbi:Crp/Fnr family transcriptional regulator [Aliiroseovarius lamellibrachiae]|uniref:Crp/Fnr family transcriptional regulator n=1 Tax=Aliiroseovarius lamellibrachiae TaxID=1924933 RepID=UPI001BDFC4AC|nr:Crp/Fnr family transcriptional regulator [Aliiroseovarius lamellibrachiae]
MRFRDDKSPYMSTAKEPPLSFDWTGSLGNHCQDMKQKIRAVGLRRTLTPGTDVYKQGECNREVIIILSGCIEVTYTTPDGDVAWLRHATKGDVLGEIEVLSGEAAAASCTVCTPTEVIILPSPALSDLYRDPIVLRALHRRVSHYLKADNQLLANALFASVNERICQRILGLIPPGQSEIQVSQTELARLVGCRREAVNRRLTALTQESVLAVSRGRIAILDRRRLAQWAGWADDLR